MKMVAFVKSMCAGLGAVLLLFSGPHACLASNLFPVAAGYDLFMTAPGGAFTFGSGPGAITVGFQGVAIHTFDFGTGAKNVGGTDTIIQRTEAVLAAGGTTHLHVAALQLKSIAAVDLGPLGLHTLFVTVDPVRQAQWESDSSHNLMTINATTFSTSNFQAMFEVHLDSLTGTVIDATDYAQLDSSGNPWQNESPPGALLIDGVNHQLNGSDEQADFWPTKIVHNGPHPVQSVPEPSSIVLLGCGLIGMCLNARCRTRIPMTV